MDDLGHLLHAYGGALERHELLDLGWNDRAIRRALRDGDLVRIRFGCYAHGPTWRHSSAEDRHRILVRAVLAKMGRHVYASHHSAAALHGFDLWDVDFTEVQVGRLDGRTDRLDAGVRFHRGTIDPGSLVEIDGVLVSPPARAVVETALGATLDAGAVTASSALRERAVTADELADVLTQMSSWPGSIAADRSIGTADGRLETVGEVRSMCLFRRFAIPRPDLQQEFCDAVGRPFARSDFWWYRCRHVGEFDGLVKYGRLNPYSTDAGQVLVDEKLREDAIRQQVAGMSRWTWQDLAPSHAADTAARIRHDLDRSRRLVPRVIDLGA